MEPNEIPAPGLPEGFVVPPASPAELPPAIVPGSVAPPFDRYAGSVVVIDTISPFIYVGTVVAADAWFVELADADCHDRGEGHSTNEKYVMEAAKFGLKVNRRRVAILRDKVISLSRVEDVTKY